MSLEIGIVGLPNVGKSTLFNALAGARAAVASYPFTTIDPNVGVVPVADRRLDDIARIVEPEEALPTTVRFVDIAGLVKGASRGEGLGNQFLGHIRGVDAIATVIRCFEAEDVVHVSETLDPVSDIEVLDTELLLGDLAVLERRLDKVRTASKGHPKDYAAEVEWLEDLERHLGAGRPARTYLEAEHDEAWVKDVALLTSKPRMFVANVGEADLPEGGPLAGSVRRRALEEGAPVVVLCAQVESALQEWSAEEATAYMRELGIEQPGLQTVVQAGYRLLDLVTFFTTTGGKKVHAWTVRRGAHAPEAAGKVHSDMERGFIRAEVVHYDELMRDGSMAAAREHGHVRTEGRDYVVIDGDILHFRFHV